VAVCYRFASSLYSDFKFVKSKFASGNSWLASFEMPRVYVSWKNEFQNENKQSRIRDMPDI